MKKALTIAGIDAIGGSGLVADIKTFTVHKVYGMSAVTLVSSQNTKEFKTLKMVEKELLSEQIDLIFQDIFPDALKTGMILSEELIDVIVEKILYYKPKNIVIDPVMITSKNIKLYDKNKMEYFKKKLFPLADLITPNLLEAEYITEIEINTYEDMKLVANKLNEEFGCGVLIKGGKKLKDANDLLYIDGEYIWLNSEKIDNQNTRGTGDTLSAAIVANLANGYDMKNSVYKAKEYVKKALEYGLDLGEGIGPINQMV